MHVGVLVRVDGCKSYPEAKREARKIAERYSQSVDTITNVPEVVIDRNTFLNLYFSEINDDKSIHWDEMEKDVQKLYYELNKDEILENFKGLFEYEVWQLHEDEYDKCELLKMIYLMVKNYIATLYGMYPDIPDEYQSIQLNGIRIIDDESFDKIRIIFNDLSIENDNYWDYISSAEPSHWRDPENDFIFYAGPAKKTLNAVSNDLRNNQEKLDHALWMTFEYIVYDGIYTPGYMRDKTLPKYIFDEVYDDTYFVILDVHI